jgi:ribosomal protein S18 acetylase RimI-like enzyme
MTKTLLRNFRNNDLEAVTRLAHLSFSDPTLQEGGTPEAVANRLRSLRRGHMRLLTRLLRYRLEMIVAEVDGNVAGFVMVTGHDNMNMNTLMVDPQYRRCGIGAALLEESFRRIHSWGYPFATAEVLTTNLPSAQLCQKVGFEVYDTYTTYETPLPLSQPAEHSPRNWVTLRPMQEGEQAAFAEIERKLVSAVDLQVRGSASRIFFPSLFRRLVDYREHKQYQAWAVEKDGRRVGFQYIQSSLGNPKGTINRPLLPDAHLNFLPSIVEMAGDWFAELGKNTLRLDVPAERPHLLDNLTNWSWQPSVQWLCLVKWLGKSH